MRLIAKLEVPAPYVVFAGADISGGVDNIGRIIWACTAKDTRTNKQHNIIVIGTGPNAHILVPRNERGGELIGARGDLTLQTNKTYYIGWDKTIDNNNAPAYLYEIDEVVPVSGGSGGSTEGVDPIAREIANRALSKAVFAESTAISAKDVARSAADVAHNAANAVQGKPDVTLVESIAWQKAGDRLWFTADRLKQGARGDAVSDFFMDVLYGKVQDWIYGFLQSRGIIK